MKKASIITRDMNDIAEPTGNIYKSIRIISQRSNQLAVKTKEELSSKLAEFATTVDNLEEIFENREQIEISRYYERMPKSPAVAIGEFMEGKIIARQRENIQG